MARYGRTGAKNDAKLINKFETMAINIPDFTFLKNV